MICSRPEWRDNALSSLKDKFLAQEYPEKMIDIQFERVLQLNRADLILRTRSAKKKNKKFKCCMVMTHHTYNPPMRQWIQEELPILHLSRKCEELFPTIPVITRQSQNVAQTVIRARHWTRGGQDEQPGNVIIHTRNCVTCARMVKIDRFLAK